jgi:uncharacterized protein YggE
VTLRRAIFALPLLALPATAQETRLRVSETGTARREPDEIQATLKAEFRNGQAAAAQAAVNRAITAALEAARTTQGIAATTTRPSANRPELGRDWVATQSITLRGGDPVVLLELAGRLQQAGLAVTDLQWRLTEPPTRAAREEAARDALRQVRARAALVADELGMQVSQLRDIYLDAAPDGPMPMAATAMRAGSYASAPPQLVREDIVITARVTADIILTPK